MTHDVIVLLAVLGVVGQVVVAMLVVAGVFRVAGIPGPLPVIGAGISIYHILVEERVVGQTTACLISAPGGCAVKWIDEFGYVTIPVLALTAFVLAFAFLAFAAFEPSADEGDETEGTAPGGYDPAE